MLRRFDRYHRFKEEIRAAENLAGLPGILEILQFNLPEKQPSDSPATLTSLPYFSMPFCSGGSLDNQLGSFDPTSDGAESVRLLLEISRIIAGIHSRGYAHRDLKPANILIDDSKSLWVSDYGLCIDLAREPDGKTTGTEEVVGAFYYRAPEYLRGRLDASDHRPGDIFSLGRLLWAFLMGKDPVGLTDIEFVKNQPSQDLPTLRRSVLLDELIVNCTQAEPANRPLIAEVILVLEEWTRVIPERSFVEFNERICGSTEAYRMQQDQQRNKAVVDAMAAAATAVGEILENHRFTQQLRRNGLRSDQPEVGGGAWWSDISKEVTVTNPTYSPGIRFNLGNLKLAPLVGLQFGFAIQHDSGNVTAEVVGGAIHNVNPIVRSWRPKEFQFERFDSFVRAKIERLIDEGFAFMLNELGIVEE